MAESDYSVGIAKLINLINFSFPLCDVDTGIFWENTGLPLPREKSTNKKPLTYVLSKSKMTEQANCFPLLREHSKHPPEPVWPLKLLRSNRKQANKPEGLSAKLRVGGGQDMWDEKGERGAFSRIQLRNFVFKDFFFKKTSLVHFYFKINGIYFIKNAISSKLHR